VNKIGDMHAQATVPEQAGGKDTVWANEARSANEPGALRQSGFQKVASTSDSPTLEIDGVIYPVKVLPAGTARNGFRGDSQFRMGYGNLSQRPIPGVDTLYIVSGGDKGR
jgi:hypothetical protein